ncbi:PREDICTED: glycosylated lysosomal membrane protein B-like [Papilio polytes]|uniref:glycosylated lysosomal membrane protein B-like n=1 Tax=Papilio polytes TaxID=76194 RepID=UPI0006762CE3|nr:PREDICTED: glycosylated lysosomal membrane protein B-like [Papilio polytes]
MFSSSITTYVIAIIAFLLHTSAYGQDRTINAEINPGCKNCSLDSTLVYIKAEGQTDTIHQIWDFTRGIPTMILAVSGTNSTMQISWDGERPVNFTMNDKVRYSFATAIDKIYEYNDLADKGRMDEKSWIHAQSLKRVRWELKEQVITEKEAMVRLHGTMHQNRSRDIIDVKLDLLPYKDYATELPHLIHTANSTLVDISLVNLTTSRQYNSSRFALHLLLVSTDPATDTMHNVMRKSLDDEHTPGVFEIIEIKSPSSLSRGDGGFMQFRPVGYTQRARNVASSTVAHVSDFNRTWLPEWSTLKTFYRGYDDDELLVQDMVVCFGEPGDGFYKRYNYTAWSYTLGYGAPPIEGFSLFVIVIISVGVGAPLLLALSGVLYALRSRTRTHSALANED